VRKAKREELDYFASKGVWRVVPRARAKGSRVVGTRWVNCNKGDQARPEIRCRLVCQEVKTFSTSDYFAATPQGESLRMILSLAAQSPRRQVRLVDISRAYFNAHIGRRVFVELPPEAGYGRGFVGELVKCMYGTRDAAQGWEKTYREAMVQDLGFRRGGANPCIFTHDELDINVTVHGDDFFMEGTAEALDVFQAKLLKKFEGKVKGVLARPGDELRVLNRVVRRTPNGYEWEADQRHADLIISGAGLAGDSKSLATPGRKLTAKEQEVAEEPLGPEQATLFRALAARANFLASDRPDIAFAVKELCRGMSLPTTRDEAAMKRLARYLVGRPRVVIHFGWQAAPKSLDVYSDSDWAGCTRTRKSTSGGALMRGHHLLKTWCSTQPTIALSSAEAELTAAVRGAAEALAARAMMRDFRQECELRILLDSSAAIGITRRSGVGRIRHLDTRLLWIQERVQSGDLKIDKIKGTKNPADLLTKHVDSEALFAHLVCMKCWPSDGRACIAPKVAAMQQSDAVRSDANSFMQLNACFCTNFVGLGGFPDAGGAAASEGGCRGWLPPRSYTDIAPD